MRFALVALAQLGQAKDDSSPERFIAWAKLLKTTSRNGMPHRSPRSPESTRPRLFE